MRGLFFTFEGIDGCGKSTQLKEIALRLERKGVPVLTTREPGGTPVAEKIREILISPENSEMVNECELFLYLAARAQHVREKIIPALQKGMIVLCDRFQEATFAYQGFGRGLSLSFLQQLNSFATDGLIPDRTFIFDVPVEISGQRMDQMKKKKDRLEQNGPEFYEKIRKGYLFMAEKQSGNCVLIDGCQEVSRISDQVWEEIAKLLG
ncbi:MAG: dTMP kinase [Fibrobacter sp.]|jgi:dTMP kinase|nr:dTMP kinase [Fibrobacter sp.]